MREYDSARIRMPESTQNRGRVKELAGVVFDELLKADFGLREQ